MTDYLTVLTKLGENATEGPWTELPGYLIASLRANICQTHDGGTLAGEQESNARFIAVSRNVWEQLIEVARAAEEFTNADCDIASTFQSGKEAARYLAATHAAERALAALKLKVTSLPNPAPSTP